ncbi:MAG: hypothetical protein DWI21_02495 [Planctomycetota bacterium]|nr:MAG: hypothetical protein DWI21_02495 [Planctomycetota bacterium]
MEKRFNGVSEFPGSIGSDPNDMLNPRSWRWPANGLGLGRNAPCESFRIRRTWLVRGLTRGIVCGKIRR